MDMDALTTSISMMPVGISTVAVHVALYTAACLRRNIDANDIDVARRDGCGALLLCHHALTTTMIQRPHYHNHPHAAFSIFIYRVQ